MGADTLWMPIHKVHTLGVFTPCCLSSLGYLFDDPFTNNVRTLSSIPRIKKTLWKLFCFVSYLRKSLSLTFLFSDSLLRVKYNVWGLTYFWALVGTIFLPWLKLKQSSKRCSRRHFSKYYQIIPEHSKVTYKNYAKTLFCCRTLKSNLKNYAKTLFCCRILHLYLQSHSLRENIFKWS